MSEIKVRNKKLILNAKKILLWGAGRQCKACISYLKKNSKAELHLFDSDDTKIGNKLCGIEIEDKEAFKEYLCEIGCIVLISSINYQYYIAKMLVEEYLVPQDILFGYTCDFYEENVFMSEYTAEIENQIQKVRCLIEDEDSKKYYDSSIRYRFNRNPMELIPNKLMQRVGEYADIVAVKKGDSIIDCGAYTGDTAEMYSSYLGGDCTVYAFEPFKESFLLLKETSVNSSGKILAFQYAVSNENKKSKIAYEDNDLRMGIRIGERKATRVEEVEVRTLDSVIQQDICIDFIKMDIEGEELKALQGAENIIRNYYPRLMISAYHKFEHILEIPKFIKEISPDYKIYMGHSPNVSTEIEIYAVLNKDQ